MPLTAPPTIPLITDPSTFAVRAQDWVVWQAEELYPALVEESLALGLSLSSTSVTSNTIGTGSKAFTVETGKGFVAGQSIVIADSATPTNRMFGVVDTYDSGTGALVFISQAFEGSGTLTAWTISPTLNAVLTAAQVPDGLITNDKLDDEYIDDLPIVTFDPAADYVAIADGSDTGKKKKALIPLNSTYQGNSSVTVTDAGTGKVKTTVDGTIISEETLASRKSTIDGGSVLYPEFKCRAWVNFDGAAATPSIRGSGNVSSITDNGAGDYTMNFTTLMPDGNYAVTGIGQRSSGTATFVAVPVLPASTTVQYTLTSSVRFQMKDNTGNSNDAFTVCMAVFR